MTATELPANLPIAILAAGGFEESHLTEVQKNLLNLNITTKVISPDGGLIQGWHEGGWGHHFMADEKMSETLSVNYAALIVPAGVRSIVSLKQKPHALRLIKAFVEAGKPLALLGEAGELLAVVEQASGRNLAAEPATCETLEAAGAIISEDAIVTDGALISTAGTVQIGAFLDVFLAALAGDEAANETDDVTENSDPVEQAA